ncbi:MAG: hypothetical protein R6V58_15685 [Planctomycetota bacterium]
MIRQPINALLAALLLTGAAVGAENGVTNAERTAATELYKQIRKGETDQAAARRFAHIYVGRAYVVELEPARKLVDVFGDREWRVSDEDQLEFFAASLDAMVRGAGLEDILGAFKQTFGSALGTKNKRILFLSAVGNADRHRSPLPLVRLAIQLNENGVVGGRLEDTMTWSIQQVERGELPGHVRQLYNLIADVTPSYHAQRDFLEKVFGYVRLGVPPAGLLQSIRRLRTKYESENLLDENLDKLMQLYGRGRSLEEATDILVPPKKDEED